MVDELFLTPEQGAMINPSVITDFFATQIGIRLKNGASCIREFKFSILDDGGHYGEGLKSEKVLLQGVVDCAIFDEDGLTVLDFKTDYVTEENLLTLVERYRDQVETYAHALSRIYQQKVKASYLYFFRLNRFVKV